MRFFCRAGTERTVGGDRLVTVSEISLCRHARATHHAVLGPTL